MDVEVAVPLLAVIMLVPTPNSVVDPRVVVRVVDPLIIVETMADVVIADVEGRVSVEEKDWYVPVGREAEDVPVDVPTRVSTSWDAAIAKREPNVRILENNMAAVIFGWYSSNKRGQFSKIEYLIQTRTPERMLSRS